MTIKPEGKPPRRSQQERREATVTKLVDATIAAIGELGYQGATIQEICSRAGLSVGAMFRQFDGKLDLVVAAMEEIVGRQLDTFRTVMAHVDASEDNLRVALRYLREVQSSGLTHAVREMFMASRSDVELRTRISPLIETYYATTVAEVERSGVMDRFPPEEHESLFFMLLHLLSGEAVIRIVYQRPDLNDRLLDLAYDMLMAYASVTAAEST